jgi:hypothetical protein
VLSINLAAPRGAAIAGTRFALYLSTNKIGFPGWPEPILDSVTGFGASIAKKGACTSPLFHFRGLFLPFEQSFGPVAPRAPAADESYSRMPAPKAYHEV